MFKAALTATALVLTTLSAQATPLNADRDPLSLGIIAPGQAEDLAYYCEWVTVYDYWGNWATVWQCF